MKYFKTEATRTAPRYEITLQNFMDKTKRNYPYEQKDQYGKFSQYGICPSCLNPIQLIGIDHKIKTNPYGRHTGKNVKGLAKWNYEKYEYCPFAAKNDKKELNDEDRLEEIDDNIIELYNLMRFQFDRIIFILEKELEIQCSEYFWRKALTHYMANRSYCYPWLTEANLPYIFAYFGVHQQRLFKQKIRVGSDLYKALQKHPDVNFIRTNNPHYEQLCNKNNAFLELFFRFSHHSQKISNDETLIEKMIFYIDDRKTGITLFEREIVFNETFFINIINKKENEDKRQQRFIDIAKEIMKPLTND